MFQGWHFILILLVVFLGVLAVSYLAAQQMVRRAAEWKARVPPIPIAFTGREEEIQQIVDCIVQKDVSIVSVTGGPGYGKSSVAIAASHWLMTHSIPVCYVSLSEADSIETFMMTLLHALTRKTERRPDKLQILSLVGWLKEKTVIVLDNADQLTLNQTELRQDFIQLLKHIVAENNYLHLVVVTRYRFRIISGFEEIHLQPLESSQTQSLLRSLMHVSSHAIGTELTDEQLQMISNVTGGIPLAIRIVGDLVKSGESPVTELLKELSIDPVNSLSDDRFTPDEQLKRCIDLSYKYLRPDGQMCFLFTAHFPGSFDHQAKVRIFSNLTSDAHCLHQLVDRSLVEYSAVNERYSVHALLRVFARDHSDARNSSFENFYQLYASHYITVLSEQVSRAKATGNVSNLYTSLVVDYHNFLQVLQLLSTNLTSLVDPRIQMNLALEAFHIMQTRFPAEVLLGWWTKQLALCVTTENYHDLTLQRMQLGIKLAQLLRHRQEYSLARITLLSANMCISMDNDLTQSFELCQHPQLSTYTTMLQMLAQVSEKEGFLHEAHVCKKIIHRCLREATNMTAEELLPNNFCSDGIGYLREEYENIKSFSSALNLFNSLLKCNKTEAANSIKLLENAFERELAQFPALSADSKGQHCMLIAKYMCLVSNHEGEVKWLVRSTEYMQHQDYFAFNIHFRLTELYWHVLNDKQKALENSRAAHAKAVHAKHHDRTWLASVRLADILSQIDGHQLEAIHYFQVAHDHLLFIDADADFIYKYRHFIEANLVLLYFQSQQFSAFFQHYYEWIKLEAAQTPQNAARKIYDMYYDMLYARHAKSSSLTTMDDSLRQQMKGLDSVWRHLNAHFDQMWKLAIWYAQFIFLCTCGVLLCVVSCVPLCLFMCCCKEIFLAPVVFAVLILYKALAFVFSFHYFLYVALVKHKVWQPKDYSVFVETAVMLLWQIVLVALFMPLYQELLLPKPHMYHNLSMHYISHDCMCLN